MAEPGALFLHFNRFRFVDERLNIADR